jgi:hypothetical protein
MPVRLIVLLPSVNMRGRQEFSMDKAQAAIVRRRLGGNRLDTVRVAREDE